MRIETSWMGLELLNTEKTLSCHAKLQWKTALSEEAGFYQTLNLQAPWSWTPTSRTWEKIYVAYKPPSLWHRLILSSNGLRQSAWQVKMLTLYCSIMPSSEGELDDQLLPKTQYKYIMVDSSHCLKHPQEALLSSPESKPQDSSMAEKILP